MVGGDYTSGRRYKEVRVGVFTGNFDVGFVTGLSGFDLAFELKVECVTVRSGVERVVEDGLIRGGQLKDVFKDIGGFTGGDA